MGNIWPEMAAQPAASVRSNCAMVGGEDDSDTAARVGSRPFAVSRTKQRYAHFLPRARARLVAPMLPEPILRRSVPCAFAMIKPKGTEPRR